MKESKYKMTIIMPSYNNGQYIRQALDSILIQETDFDYQIIVTDDCSQDDSPQIIREYAEKYPERMLALYSDENCRLFRNMLKALKEMDSEYFCVLDPDDYWTDRKRLQKAVDFLDRNPDYTIYATNAEVVYNNGMIKPKYNLSTISTCTSTYEDFLKRKAVLSTTIASTYRNVYFSDGIPAEFLQLTGTHFEEMFRADSARNLIHLKRGKAYFINESVGCYRYHGKGLASSISEYERYITSAFAHVAFFEFFGQENEADYVAIIKGLYVNAVKLHFKEIASGKIPMVTEQYRQYFNTVMEWLHTHQAPESEWHIPFSLEKFGKLYGKKTILWGTGQNAGRIIKRYHIPIHEDTFFVDNDSQKQGTVFMGKMVKAPEALLAEPDALVVIVSCYYREIVAQIREQGLCTDDRIVNVYDYENYGIWN